MRSLSGYVEVKPLTDALLAAVRAKLVERLTAVALYGSIARVVRHARAITFQLAKVAETATMVWAILDTIRRLQAPPSCA